MYSRLSCKVKLLYWFIESSRSVVMKSYYTRYIESSRSVVMTQRAFKTHYKTKKAPARNTIINIMKKMDTTGSINNRNPPGAEKPARTPEKILRICRRKMDGKALTVGVCTYPTTLDELKAIS